MQWRYGRVRVNFGGVVGVSRNIVPRQRSGTGMHAGPSSGTKLDTCSTVTCLSPCRETCLTPLLPRTRLCYAWGLCQLRGRSWGFEEHRSSPTQRDRHACRSFLRDETRHVLYCYVLEPVSRNVPDPVVATDSAVLRLGVVSTSGA